MRAGSLRHKFTVQRATVTRDSHGQEVRTWSRIGTTWGEIVTSEGREFVDGGGTEQHVKHTAWIRYFRGLQASDRLLHDGRTFHVEQVTDFAGRREKMRLAVTEVL